MWSFIIIVLGVIIFILATKGKLDFLIPHIKKFIGTPEERQLKSQVKAEKKARELEEKAVHAEQMLKRLKRQTTAQKKIDKLKKHKAKQKPNSVFGDSIFSDNKQGKKSNSPFGKSMFDDDNSLSTTKPNNKQTKH